MLGMSELTGMLRLTIADMKGAVISQKTVGPTELTDTDGKN